MTVADLIEKLKTMPQDRRIIVIPQFVEYAHIEYNIIWNEEMNGLKKCLKVEKIPGSGVEMLTITYE